MCDLFHHEWSSSLNILFFLAIDWRYSCIFCLFDEMQTQESISSVSQDSRDKI